MTLSGQFLVGLLLSQIIAFSVNKKVQSRWGFRAYLLFCNYCQLQSIMSAVDGVAWFYFILRGEKMLMCPSFKATGNGHYSQGCPYFPTARSHPVQAAQWDGIRVNAIPNPGARISSPSLQATPQLLWNSPGNGANSVTWPNCKQCFNVTICGAFLLHPLKGPLAHWPMFSQDSPVLENLNYFESRRAIFT